MGIRVKAIERNVSFDKNNKHYAFVLQTDIYGQLSPAKVIAEASMRSGIGKGVMNAAYAAIGEVIVAWATEGHSVSIPGLGTMRFGLRSTAVEDVNKVSASLITARRVIFTPSVAIKQELADTAVSITCYDRNGKIVKQVTSTDKGDVDDTEGGNSAGGSGNSGSGSDSGSGSQGGGSTENPGSDLEL